MSVLPTFAGTMEERCVGVGVCTHVYAHTCIGKRHTLKLSRFALPDVLPRVTTIWEVFDGPSYI
jgi:hypothetical protein